MQLKNPNIDFYKSIFRICKKTNLAVFDDLPDDSTPYPFIVIGEIDYHRDYDSMTAGHISVTVDVWGNQDQRYDVLRYMSLIESYGDFTTNDFAYIERADSNSNRILNDYSVENTVLLHGILDLNYDWFTKNN